MKTPQLRERQVWSLHRCVSNCAFMSLVSDEDSTPERKTDSTINGAVESQLESRAGNDSSTADSTTSLITVDDESSSDTPLPDAQPNFKRTASELSSSEAEEAVEKKGRGEVDLHEPLVEQIPPVAVIRMAAATVQAAAAAAQRTQPQRRIASVPIRTGEPEPNHCGGPSSNGLTLRIKKKTKFTSKESKKKTMKCMFTNVEIVGVVEHDEQSFQILMADGQVFQIEKHVWQPHDEYLKEEVEGNNVVQITIPE
ncbi:uncharacterized protein V6R79_016138 [Siganus canaliculatus]